MVEHRPYKARVVGSSPSASTIFYEKVILYGRVAKWPNAVDCKSIPNGFGGSNPSSSTTLLGYSQAVRHQTLTLTFPWFESTYPSQSGPLAQSVEHVTFNHGVASSNLVRITIFCARMAEQVDAQDLKSCGLRNPCQFDSGSGHHFFA